jgi:hypothetical protein
MLRASGASNVYPALTVVFNVCPTFPTVDCHARPSLPFTKSHVLLCLVGSNSRSAMADQGDLKELLRMFTARKVSMLAAMKHVKSLQAENLKRYVHFFTCCRLNRPPLTESQYSGYR